jgi:integrase
MASVAKPHKKGGNYRAIYTDHHGKRKFVAGTQNRKETLAIAQKLEDDHRQIRLGYRDVPTSARKHRSRPFEEVASDYLRWGDAQGGRNGRPWSKMHSQRRRAALDWWKDQLGLNTLHDLTDVLPRVEKALIIFGEKGRTGKTLHNQAEALKAFCNWCVNRGLLGDDPLKALAPFDTTPQSRRRAMTSEEIGKLLSACQPEHQLLYETALCSGLRANELRNLTIDHLDEERGGLRLDAKWTKNRKSGFQPLPRDLVNRLKAAAAADEPWHIYKAKLRKANSKKSPPKRPLLYVPTHQYRCFSLDLEVAGIPKITPKGKLDFHALRVTYINLVFDSDISVRDAQALARHSTPDQTLNVYGRPRDDRMAEAVEQVTANVLFKKNRAISVQRLAVGAERENATLLDSEGCVSKNMVGVIGFEPTTPCSQSRCASRTAPHPDSICN